MVAHTRSRRAGVFTLKQSCHFVAYHNHTIEHLIVNKRYNNGCIYKLIYLHVVQVALYIANK